MEHCSGSICCRVQNSLNMKKTEKATVADVIEKYIDTTLKSKKLTKQENTAKKVVEHIKSHESKKL